MRRTNQLVCKEKNSLQAELATTIIEKDFERRAKDVEEHNVVIAFLTEPLYERDTNATCESSVDFIFMFELGMSGLD